MDADAGEPAALRDQSPITVPIMYLLQVTLLPGQDLGPYYRVTLSVLFVTWRRYIIGTVSGLWSRCVAGSLASTSKEPTRLYSTKK